MDKPNKDTYVPPHRRSADAPSDRILNPRTGKYIKDTEKNRMLVSKYTEKKSEKEIIAEKNAKIRELREENIILTEFMSRVTEALALYDRRRRICNSNCTCDYIDSDSD